MSNLSFNDFIEAVVDLRNSREEESSSDDDNASDTVPDTDGVEVEEESSTMGETESRGQQHFDTQLPSLHSYLGAELEVVRGRTVLEDGAEVTLDLLQPADLILMPGQTLPLTVFDTPTINMLQNCIRNDHTFGVLASWTDGLSNNTTITTIGITAEIYEYLPQEGSAGFRVKAKARQRFRLLEVDSSKWRGRVRILPEVRLPDPLDGVKLESLRRLRSSATNRLRCRRADAAVTRWPTFVYEQYNIQKILPDVKKQLRSSILQVEKNNVPVKVMIPDEPTELSFWVAHNMPLKEEHRLLLLKLNSPIQRLRFERNALKLMKYLLFRELQHSASPSCNVDCVEEAADPELSSTIQTARPVPFTGEDSVLANGVMSSPVSCESVECQQVLCCQNCMNVIGFSADVFSMSSEGPQSTFVNPGGYLHETITLHKTFNIFSMGFPSTEFSWFPGYAWTICKCRHCGQHMGWKFKSTSDQLRPEKFWGLCRRSISLKKNIPAKLEDKRQALVF